jgi:hypothetical protein
MASPSRRRGVAMNARLLERVIATGHAAAFARV